MPAPQTPLSVDDVLLSTGQRAWLDRLIAVVHGTDPTRAAAGILGQAIRSFRKVHRVVSGAWIRRSVVQLGTGASDAIIDLGVDEES